MPLKSGVFPFFMAFIQFFYLYQLSATNDVGGVSFSLGSIGLIILSMVSVYWFFHGISVATSKSRCLRILGLCIGFVIYDLLIAYQFGSQELADWSFIVSNISEAFSIETLDVMISSLDPGALNYIPGILGVFWVLEWWRNTLSRVSIRTAIFPKSIVILIVYLGFIAVPLDSYDPNINFFRSVIHYYKGTFKIEVTVPKTNPFIHNSQKFDHIKLLNTDEQRPAVFLIVCESLNARSIHQNSRNGKPITPFLNELTQTAVYLPIFYGNSIQTAKGHFGTYFSTIPGLTGKTFVNHKSLNIKSIASVLGENGYRTIYFNAHKNGDFDNTKDFLTQRGFGEFETVNPYLQASDLKTKLKWGVEDQFFFKRFFDYYDQTLSQEKKPLFVTLATIANHFPFNSMPESRRLIYPKPEGIRDHYSNSIHLTDIGLKVFFEELKKRPELNNSLIIITGDHAFPLGEHGNYHLESGYHEESFRIPMFLIWNTKLKPQVIPRASSQLDIAPTILDLLEINDTDTQFIGQSIFSKTSESIYLIQPYVKHLSVIQYPLKYRFNTRFQKEYLYDLEKDPMETQNILSTLPKEQLANFRAELQKIYLNDHYIHQNLFWPEAE